MKSPEPHVRDIVSRESPEPLYRQIAALIEGQVRSGQLEVGSRLDAEPVLARRFDVSRVTVRLAIGELARKGLVVRKQGKGTFISQPAVRHDLRRLHGLLGTLFAQSDKAHVDLLRYELRVPPADVRHAMGLRAGQPALLLVRLYMIDDKPVLYGEDWLIAQAAEVPRATARLISTEDILRQVGVRLAYAETSIRAETVGADARKSLKVPMHAPVLMLRRTAYGEDGGIKEFGRLAFCSDSYEFYFSTRASGAAANPLAIRTVVGADEDKPENPASMGERK